MKYKIEIPLFGFDQTTVIRMSVSDASIFKPLGVTEWTTPHL